MERIAGSILEHRRDVLLVTILTIIICGVLMTQVNVNFNLSDYLPADAPSTKALDALYESFSGEIPNANVYIPDVSVPEALIYKKQLAGINGVDTVMWLDDALDIRTPLEMHDKDSVESWYKNGGALFVLSIDSDNVSTAIEEVRRIAGDKSVLSGEAVNMATVQTVTMSEISKIMLYVIPLVLIILLISTSSWLEPLLFLGAIGSAIIINEGTNIFIGEVSYVTQATSAVLQLAVSIDYAVFLLHSYAHFRKEGLDINAAMKKAMVKSSSAIAASAATTVFGFLALTLMKFKIGPDMGFILAKGVFFSYVSVVVFLPALAVCTSKFLEKTRHRSLMPSFKGFGRIALHICIPLAAIIFIMIIPGFLAQRSNEFLYGSSGMHSENSKIRRDAEYVKNIFGESSQMVLLIPRNKSGIELELTEELSGISNVKSVISYSSMVGDQVPEEFLTESQLTQFRSERYNRIILYVATEDESAEAFQAVEGVRKTVEKYCGKEYHLTGQSVINYDLKDTITGDYLPVTLASIAAIGLVLVIAFRSVSIPLILLLTIEGAIWLNLGLPYFTGDSLNYIGYQIISAVQLGATVDYGILFVKRYMDSRADMNCREACYNAITGTAASILAPAAILTLAGVTLGIVSTNGIISQLGTILGRGAAISAAMVLLFLPALLMMTDKIIQKTTYIRNTTK